MSLQLFVVIWERAWHSYRMAIILYQPDIPQNLGAILRLGACMGQAVHLIEPCGFPWDDRRIRRAGMDYIDHVEIIRHSSWERFLDQRQGNKGRLCLLTTKGTTSLYDVTFSQEDDLLFGRESSGVPEAVHQNVALRLRIPMTHKVRSLNLAMSAAMTLGEWNRQCGVNH